MSSPFRDFIPEGEDVGGAGSGFKDFIPEREPEKQPEKSPNVSTPKVNDKKPR